MYVVVSLGFVVYFRQILHPYIANDLWWPRFNTSGGHSFLIDAVNMHLATPVHDPSWCLTSMAMDKDYHGARTSLSVVTAAGRRIVLQDTRLEASISRLVPFPPKELLSMMTQFCWVDFDRRWGLAHTAKRQERCHANDLENAAVYLEAPLRLMQWAEFDALLGKLFRKAIGNHLLPPEDGQAWVDHVARANVVDANVESALWRSHGLTRFTLQWHNYRRDGLLESVDIVTAISSHPIRLKQIPYELMSTQWTTNMCYWGVWNDWYSADVYNVSLVTVADPAAAIGGAPSVQSTQMSTIFNVVSRPRAALPTIIHN